MLEHKTAQLHQTRFIALAVVLLILLLCMFFVIKSMRSGKRLEESRHRVLQLKLEGARNRISLISSSMSSTTRFCMPVRRKPTS